MKVSDTILAQPVELAGAELDAVSAGVSMITKRENPLHVLLADIKQVEETILSDLGLGKKRATA
ncbi:MAG TPA: hypothetical protein VMA37_16485 [Acetobacteraceae bacterium]|nr:hypothetical protein [Acetobacteraceae bacterium]